MFCHRKWKLVLLTVLAFSPYCGQVFGQPGKVFQESRNALKAGNRLKAVRIQKEFVAKDKQFYGTYLQSLPDVSDYSIAHPYSEAKVKKVQNADRFKKLESRVKDIERHEAIKKIVEMAKGRRVVILNEAHDMAQHRAFGMQLALELRKAGFNYLAMETLSTPSQKSGLVSIKYPSLNSGYYISDPVFADFVRNGISAGYKLAAYEIEPGQRKKENEADFALSIMERENAQSDNLIKHVLEADPNSRVFVYVGYSHATENWKQIREHNIGWFAAQLKKKTGIDPLTIDQVGGTHNPQVAGVDPVLKLLEDSKTITKPTLATYKNQPIVSDSYFGKVDCSVFHPIHKLVDGRPNWLRLGGYRKPVKIENKNYFSGQPTLVQAFIPSEKKDAGNAAIPVDQVLVNSAEGHSTLLLPKGKYQIVISTEKENKMVDKKVSVK